MGKVSVGSVVCCALFLQCVTSQMDMESLGKAAKGRLGNLYNLRNKLTRTSVAGTDVGNNGNIAGIRRNNPSSQRKESRGYAFHLSSSDITNPMFTQSYNTRDFHSRMGKVSDGSRKWKTPDKSVDKYEKYAYKVDSDSSWKESQGSGLNSFNIHQLDGKNGSQEMKTKVKIISITTPLPTTSSSSSTPPPVLSSTKKSTFSSNGIDISPIKAIGQGLNSAMTTVLTQKLMGMIDQEVPQGFLNPLKHLVSSGQRMVEFWDKRANARDGKAPGIVEMFGYGIEQLKKYRDGQQMLPTDPIANITSASKTMIQGMMVVKKLTNRVLGYDTDEAVVESRGGYGGGDHGGYGWGHHVSYGHYLDPYAILATLGFGVFLFNVIFNLLNNAPAGGASGRGIGGLDPFALLAALAFGAFLLQLLLTLLNTSQRSLDVVDINVPLLMSDYHVPNIMTRMDKLFGTPTIRTRRSVEEDSPYFNSMVDKLEGIYKTYKTVSGNPSCARLYMCRAVIQDPTGDDRSLFSQLYALGLGQLSGDMAAVTEIKSLKHRMANGEDVNCETEIQGCTE